MTGYLGNLSKSQESSLNQFKELLTKEALADERTLLRYLRARSFDVQGAHRQFLATLQWRKENGIDDILDKPRPLDKEMKNIMASGFHSYDKMGRPCYIEYTGRTDIQALIKLPLDQVISRHIWNCEKQIARMKESSKDTLKRHLFTNIEMFFISGVHFDIVAGFKWYRGTHVETMVHIHDMTGASLALRKALSLFKNLAKLDQEYYPERMGKIFLVNTSWMFPVLWKIARVFLDPKTRAKCVVLKSGESYKLLEYFDEDNLPEEFGGKCQCEDGCLPPIPKHMRYIAEAPSLTEQTLGPKKFFEKSIECINDGDSIAWYFTCSNKDVKFGVKFKPRPHSGWKDRVNEIAEIWVIEAEYVYENDCVTGFYTPPCPGICILVWDNLDSKWLSRTIKYQLIVSEAEADSEEENNSNGINHKRTAAGTMV